MKFQSNAHCWEQPLDRDRKDGFSLRNARRFDIQDFLSGCGIRACTKNINIANLTAGQRRRRNKKNRQIGKWNDQAGQKVWRTWNLTVVRRERSSGVTNKEKSTHDSRNALSQLPSFQRSALLVYSSCSRFNQLVARSRSKSDGITLR